MECHGRISKMGVMDWDGVAWGVIGLNWMVRCGMLIRMLCLQP